MSALTTFLWLGFMVNLAHAEGYDVQDKLAFEQQAEALSGKFAADLKKTLMAAVQSGGLSAGVQVCHSEAAKIAQSYSSNGWEIGRTSLKTRNHRNQPNAEQLHILQSFADKLAQGADISSLSQVSYNEDDKRYLYMKPIATQALCLACHGDNIEPQLHSKIKALYPQDTATGFKLGDMRGAFTVTYQAQ